MRTGSRRAESLRPTFNGLVFALVVCAVAVGAAAGWVRYSKKRACGFRDAAQDAMGGLLPEFSLAGGRLAPDPGCNFICPQCGSYCMMRGRTGSPLCPFCKQAMVPEVPAITRAAGIASASPSLIPVQAGVKPPHDNRGACTNCHTVVRAGNWTIGPAIQSGVTRTHRNRGACTTCHTVLTSNGQPVPVIAVDAVAPHPERGTCANCHVVTANSPVVAAAAAPTPAAVPVATAPASPASAAPATTSPATTGPAAAKPILIKPFGMEVVSSAPLEGAKVSGVMGSSNASKAGVAVGDLIIELNGKKVIDAEAFLKLITAAPPEANAQLKVLRNGRMQKVAVMVGEGEMEGFTPIPKP